VLGPAALAARVANERTSDGAYRPLKNIIGLWVLEGVMKEFSSRPRRGSDWTALIAAAESLPRSPGLLDTADPALANPPSMRAELDRQLRSKGRPMPRTLAGYTRLICDSLGADHAQAKTAFEAMTGRTFQRILIVGGGSRNRLLCQATADAAGVPVVSYRLEGTAVGNLARQFIALGAVESLGAFRRHLASSLPHLVYRCSRGR
jgi:rhamnulokinase